jgi:hypothetical protein
MPQRHAPRSGGAHYTLPCLGNCPTVTALEDKVENALNETRMLILGAQVLLGFEFQSNFQPVYERLPSPVQEVKVVSLTLMLLAAGLLIAPGAFHQIVERGNDSPRVIQFTGQIASLALLPFALGIGLDVYVASHVVLSPGGALPRRIGRDWGFSSRQC